MTGIHSLHPRYILCAIAFCFATAIAFGQTYSEGYNKYVQGDFAGAENEFQGALNQRVSTLEKARIYKMLGISQYMQGKRGDAERSFTRAKQLKSDIAISSAEVLDESVVEFFDSIKVAAPAPKALPAPAPKVEVSRPVPTRAPEPKAEIAKLRIITNAEGASVAIDGHFRGSASDILAVPPGTHEVEVYAEGYANLSLPIEIKANQLNDATFKLRKKEAPRVQTATEPEDTAKKEAKPKKRTQHKNKKAVVAQETSKSSTLVNLMPFGIPQYAKGETVWGIVFSLTQVGCIAFSFSKWNQANARVISTNDEVNERNEREAQIADDSEAATFHQETLDYYSGQLTKINQERQLSYISVGVFVGLWATSSLLAFYGSSGPTNTTMSEKPNVTYTNLYNGMAMPTAEIRHVEPRFNWAVYPRMVADSPHQVRNVLTLDLRLKF